LAFLYFKLPLISLTLILALGLISCTLISHTLNAIKAINQ
jgi:hypothetical protein